LAKSGLEIAGACSHDTDASRGQFVAASNYGPKAEIGASYLLEGDKELPAQAQKTIDMRHWQRNYQVVKDLGIFCSER
jgi:hypothetical protein